MQLKKYALRGMIILAVFVALCILFAGTIRTLTIPKVRFAGVKNGKFEKVTELSGKVVFPEEEEIRMKVPEGYSLSVTGVSVTAGQKVKKGDKLLTAELTDAEKTLANLQKEYDTAQATLDTWERKNGEVRLTRGETQWMEAYEAAREAESAEMVARMDVMTHMEDGQMPEQLPENAGTELKDAWAAWEKAAAERDQARRTLKDMDRYAIADEVWTQLEQKREAEAKRAEAENQIIALRLLIRRISTLTAAHDGYVSAVDVQKGGVVTGDEPLLSMTPEGSNPVIRIDTSKLDQKLQKGASVTVDSDDWGRTDTKVVNTGLSISGHPYADAEINRDVIYALGQVSDMMKKEEIKVTLNTKAQESSCLVPAAAVRGSGKGRFVYVGEEENSAFGGKRIIVRKTDVTVLDESASMVSVAEDLTYSKVLYMEDRPIEENGIVMPYEEQ